MDHEQALALLKEHIKNPMLLKHCFAVEAIMKGLAEHLEEDQDRWALAGLLHDIDFEETAPDYKQHSILSKDILSGKVDDDIIRAVQAHGFDISGVQPESKMDKALIAADAISGLIIAAALIIPSKKLSDVKAESIGKRFKEKWFAKKCSRERMLYCEQIGIDRNKFYEIALKSLQSISDELGL